MHDMLIALVATVLTAGQTGSQETAVMSTVNQFVGNFNNGDTKAVVATCADAAAIIDEFPPYEWHGAGTCSRWMSDYDADARKNRITDGFVTLSKPRHIDIAADRAYVVVPADYTYKKNGKPVKETGSMLTLALQQGASGWRITGWSWAKN